MVVGKSFGQWLKQRRKTLDLTREDLAQRIGCAIVTLNKIEADERRPSKQIAMLLAVHLNIPSNEHDAFVQFARTDAATSSVPWGTPFHPPTNLPAQPTLLIGRDEETAAICKRMRSSDARLITLIGPPGIGKTRLAQEVASMLLDDFTDGAYFVNLAPITDIKLVATTIVNTLNIPGVGPQTPLERLTAFLRHKQVLLILDNFEQILAVAPQIAELLAECLLLKLLITSRAPLRIRQEQQWPVPALAVPDLAHLPGVEAVAHYSAVMLFLERSQTVKPDFLLTEENVSAVTAICARLDGLPLAIELISARIKLLSPAALLERLHGPLMLQSDGLRDIEPRHRTLNAAIDWSYQLLSNEEQILLRRLGIFVGGWTLESAEAICLDHLDLNLINGLASLLDKSLIKHETRPNGEPRFMMLETIREYVHKQLSTTGEVNDLRIFYINYFAKLVEKAETHVFSREQLIWFNRLEAEWDNLQSAFLWSQDSAKGLYLVGALGWFFHQGNHWKEGHAWLMQVLAANPDAPPFIRSQVLNSAGSLAHPLGNKHLARVLLNEGLALARANDDRWNMAWALYFLGNQHDESDQESLARRVTLLDESLALFRELGNPPGRGYVLISRSYCALDQKDYPYLRLLLDELMELGRNTDNKYFMGWAAALMGRLAWEADHDLGQTKLYYEQGALLLRAARATEEVNMMVSMLAGIELALGNYERSETLNKEAIRLDRESEANPRRISFMLAGLATVAKVRGQFERAARLLGSANAEWLVQFATLHPEIVPYESDIATVREQLGEVAFAEAWAEGCAMTREEVVDYALSEE